MMTRPKRRKSVVVAICNNLFRQIWPKESLERDNMPDKLTTHSRKLSGKREHNRLEKWAVGALSVV